jgi:hypothetical protein
MKPTKRSRKTVSKSELKPLYIFFCILGMAGLWLFLEVNKPVFPSPPSAGPGLVPIRFGNAGPEPMDVRITSETGTVYSVRIPECPTCMTLTVESQKPPACPSDTTYKQFALSPTAYQVDVYTKGESTYSSKLNLTNGKPYEGCVFLVRIPPKHRELQDGL